MARPSYAVVHHVDGPHVRLGLAWFAVTVTAALTATVLLAVVMAVAAALAANELLRHHAGAERPLLEEPVRLTTVLGAAALPLAAGAGADTLVAALAATTVAALLVGFVIASDPPLLAQSLPVLLATAIGLAAAAPVLLSRVGTAAGLLLLVLVAAYDAGDFIVGTDAGTRWEGPVAGVAAVAVLGFAATVFAPPPLDEEGSAGLALVVAALAPLGPPVASLLVGDGATRARFTRRLDSLLLAGPVAAYAVAALVSSR